jgi:hypothetical protein
MDRAIAQVIIRRLSTTATLVRSQIKSCGTCGFTGAGFLRDLLFPLPILISPSAPYSSLNQGWYSRPISCLSPPQETKQKNKKMSTMPSGALTSTPAQIQSGKF